MNENQTGMENMNPMDILASMENVLDKLPDAQGRVKCGYIWILSELVDTLRAKLLQPPQPLQTETVPEPQSEEASED